MGQRLAAVPASKLKRVARDVHMSEAARKAAQRELDRRERDGLCPRGRGCADFRCEMTHA